MIRIAVCDDNASELGEMLRIIDRYAQRHPEQEITAQGFSSPYALLGAVENGQFHDIYVLDIVMPHISGIELGHYIRSRNNACAIIFCTITPEYALESYCVQAQNYLVKPIQESALLHALEQALQRLSYDQAKGISLHTAEGQSFVPFHQIVYLELANRRIRLHPAKGEPIQSLLLRGSFESALADLLSEPRFLQPHKSFVVNMEHIANQQPGALVMDNGARVPVAVRKRAAVIQQYFNYLEARRREIQK